jgi:hypothetical protein
MEQKHKNNCLNCVARQQENSRLIKLLSAHNIPWADEKPALASPPTREELVKWMKKRAANNGE